MRSVSCEKYSPFLPLLCWQSASKFEEALKVNSSFTSAKGSLVTVRTQLGDYDVAWNLLPPTLTQPDESQPINPRQCIPPTLTISEVLAWGRLAPRFAMTDRAIQVMECLLPSDRVKSQDSYAKIGFRLAALYDKAGRFEDAYHMLVLSNGAVRSWYQDSNKATVHTYLTQMAATRQAYTEDVFPLISEVISVWNSLCTAHIVLLRQTGDPLISRCSSLVWLAVVPVSVNRFLTDIHRCASLGRRILDLVCVGDRRW